MKLCRSLSHLVRFDSTDITQYYHTVKKVKSKIVCGVINENEMKRLKNYGPSAELWGIPDV